MICRAPIYCPFFCSMFEKFDVDKDYFKYNFSHVPIGNFHSTYWLMTNVSFIPESPIKVTRISPYVIKPISFVGEFSILTRYCSAASARTSMISVLLCVTILPGVTITYHNMVALLWSPSTELLVRGIYRHNSPYDCNFSSYRTRNIFPRENDRTIRKELPGKSISARCYLWKIYKLFYGCTNLGWIFGSLLWKNQIRQFFFNIPSTNTTFVPVLGCTYTKSCRQRRRRKYLYSLFVFVHRLDKNQRGPWVATRQDHLQISHLRSSVSHRRIERLSNPNVFLCLDFQITDLLGLDLDYKITLEFKKHHRGFVFHSITWNASFYAKLGTLFCGRFAPRVNRLPTCNTT